MEQYVVEAYGKYCIGKMTCIKFVVRIFVLNMANGNMAHITYKPKLNFSLPIPLSIILCLVYLFYVSHDPCNAIVIYLA